MEAIFQTVSRAKCELCDVSQIKSCSAATQHLTNEIRTSVLKRCCDIGAKPHFKRGEPQHPNGRECTRYQALSLSGELRV
ncbi:hypothetical protein JOB18_020724 [Solea senegalensis]|uniref:Uncharacterized protein n=1 Tax=Solea senegalensis TaxID=28829 RepID=A0AAV6T6I5_SOLSE|nr:hypothetical protein JOB18_020724 [Solea senegalensis]